MAVDPYIARGITPLGLGLPELALEMRGQQQRYELGSRELDNRQAYIQEQGRQFDTEQTSAADKERAMQNIASLHGRLGQGDLTAVDELAVGFPALAQLKKANPEAARKAAYDQLSHVLGSYGQTNSGEQPMQVTEQPGPFGSKILMGGNRFEVVEPPRPQQPHVPDTPSAIAEWQAYQAMPPEQRAEYLKMKRANATPEDAQAIAGAKATGKGFGENFLDIQKSGQQADFKIARYQRLGQLLEGLNTGKLKPSITELAAIGSSLGITIDPKLGEAQAAQALSNEIALQLRNPSGGAGMPGAMSDADRQFLVNMTPNLGKDPRANKMMIDTAVKLAKREKDVARLAREYRKDHGALDDGFYDVLSQFADSHPLFGGGAPKAGDVIKGYKFKGGDPSKKENWIKQ